MAMDYCNDCGCRTYDCTTLACGECAGRAAAAAVLCEKAATWAPALDAKCILVWSFYDAPEVLRQLSGHGGDEDWLAWVPPGIDDTIFWAQPGTPFGCCDVLESALPNGARVLIGAHG